MNSTTDGAGSSLGPSIIFDSNDERLYEPLVELSQRSENTGKKITVRAMFFRPSAITTTNTASTTISDGGGSGGSGNAGPEILLVRRADTETYPCSWELPGGGAEVYPNVAEGGIVDNSLFEAIKRESEEETGLSLEPSDVIAAYGEFYDPTRQRYIFIANPSNLDHQGSQIRLNPGEHSEWGWYTSTSIKGLMMRDSMRRSIDDGLELTRAQTDSAESR